MIDHKYKVFFQLCQNRSSLKTAEVLGLTQPAVSKCIRELEKELGITLFNRTRNGMEANETGDMLYRRLQPIIREERKLAFDIDRIRNRYKGELKIGGSTTLAQYVLPEILSGFRKEYPGSPIILSSGNTEQVEEAVLKGRLDLAFIEGNPTRKDLHYIPVLRDELVLVSSSKSRYPSRLKKEELPRKAFIFRERESGTYHVIRKKMEEAGIGIEELESHIRIGSTEGIKRYLLHTPQSVALLSVFSIRQELQQGSLQIIDIDDLDFTRTFHAIHTQGEPDPYAARFLDFVVKKSGRYGK